MTTSDSAQLLTATEAGKRLNVDPAKVHKLPIPRHRLPGCTLYAVVDVECYEQGKPFKKRITLKGKGEISRQAFAKLIRYNAGSVKRWGWQGHGPVFKRGIQRGKDRRPAKYPIKNITAWLNGCRQAA